MYFIYNHKEESDKFFPYIFLTIKVDQIPWVRALGIGVTEFSHLNAHSASHTSGTPTSCVLTLERCKIKFSYAFLTNQF